MGVEMPREKFRVELEGSRAHAHHRTQRTVPTSRQNPSPRASVRQRMAR